MRRTITTITFLSLLVMGCSSTPPKFETGKALEGEVVEAEGLAAYFPEDLSNTQAASLAAAQRAAIDLVVSVYVNATTRMENAVQIEQSILSRTSHYIKRHEILSRGQSGADYKTRVRVLVVTSDLKKDLAAKGYLGRSSTRNPRLTILLQEYVKERPTTDGRATLALAQSIASKGFKVVALPSSVDKDADPVETARVMKRVSAELLVAGYARAQQVLDKNKKARANTLSAAISFRVIEVGTGEVLQTVLQTATAEADTLDKTAQKAFEAAAELAAKDLVPLPQTLAKRAHIQMTISGLKSFGALAQLQKSLLIVSGVLDLNLISFDQQLGVAKMDILADELSTQALADHAVRIGGPDWSVYQVSGNAIQLNASQAGR